MSAPLLALFALSWQPQLRLARPAARPFSRRPSLCLSKKEARPSDENLAMMRQLVSHTAVMEDMMRQSAKDVETKPGVAERLDAGMPVISREDMVQSSSVMMKNSGLAAIPGAHKAASSLESIAAIAEAGQGPLSSSDCLAIADLYSAVREECRRVSEALRHSLPREQQDEGEQRVAPSSISMKADATPEPAPEPLSAANALAGAVWLGLVAWSFTGAPGPFPDPIGPKLVATLAAQPVPRPESINELFYAVFNSFSVVAACIAALTLPSGGKLEAYPRRGSNPQTSHALISLLGVLASRPCEKARALGAAI